MQRFLAFLCLLLTLTLSSAGDISAQAQDAVHHLQLTPGGGHTLAELCALHGANLIVAESLNFTDRDQRLGEEQTVILPIELEIALSKNLVEIQLVAAAPGQTLQTLADELELPGPLLSRLNGLALDDRLFPGQPVKTPMPVRATGNQAVGQIRVAYASPYVAQGTIGFLSLTAPRTLSPQAVWQGRSLHLTPIESTDYRQLQRYIAPLPAHPLAEPAQETIHVSYENQEGVTVSGVVGNAIFGPNTFRNEVIRVPDAVLQELTLEAMLQENATLEAIWARISPGPWPSAGWRRPVGAENSTTSPFGSRREYVASFEYPVNFHSGHDFDTEVGTEVFAAAAGIVTVVDNMPSKGHIVIIDHGQGVFSGYWHLHKAVVGTGERVQAGQLVALAGSSGVSTGPHLHWEMRVQGVPVNPLQFLSDPLVPAEAQQ